MITIEQLEKRKAGLVSYLHLKVDDDDWHGVQDAASDIREVEAALTILRMREALDIKYPSN